MRSFLRSIRQFLSELRRRNVYQVLVTYVVVGFFVIEAADLTLTRLGLPGWTVTLVVVLVGLGFPIALVLTWALEMTPEGVRVEEPEGSEEVRTAASSPRDLWIGASILVLLLFGAWWMWGGLGEGGGSTQGESRAPETQDRSIAVLPFEVSGAGAETWRDGMVTTLSLNLDGAAGLRAIADRTVLATWKEAGGAGEGTSVQEALAVARDVGAEYAVVGSAVQLGEDLRFAAKVRRARSGERLGQVEVKGTPGEVTTLTDELTRKVLGLLLGQGDEAIPSVDLEQITTSSLTALKAYLEGERHLRSGLYEAAAQAFGSALEEDSTFALAQYRQAHSKLWFGDWEKALRRAYELRGRLPPRERRILEGEHLFYVQGRPLAARDTFQELTETYPDDARVWYEFGDVIMHAYLPGGWGKTEEAHQRAVRLDPGSAQYHHHLVEIALSLHQDRDLMAKRIEAHPEGPQKAIYQVLYDLKFGAPSRRDAAWLRLDTLSLPDNPTWLRDAFAHPADRQLKEDVLRRLMRREDVRRDEYWPRLARSLIAQGKLEEGLSLANEEMNEEPSCGAVAEASILADLLGNAAVRRQIESVTRKDRVKENPLNRLMCDGLFLIEEGRGNKLPQLIAQIEEAVDTTAARGAAARVRLFTNELRGYRAWKAGNVEKADRLWSESKPVFWHTGSLWRGDLRRQQGRLEEAEAWYRAAWINPLAHERLGRLYEEMGRPQDARAAYKRFIEAWKDADPELQGRVEKARSRLDALGGGGPAE